MVVDMLTSPQESVRSPAVALAFALRHLSGFGFGGGKILGNAMETMGKIWENMGTWDGKWGLEQTCFLILVSYLVVLFFDAELDGIPTVPAATGPRLRIACQVDDEEDLDDAVTWCVMFDQWGFHILWGYSLT